MTSGVSATGNTSPFHDAQARQRHDIAVGSSPGLMAMADTGHEKANSLGLRNPERVPISAQESNILFVDGLPTDCTRREVGRILAPYALVFFFFLLFLLSIQLYLLPPLLRVPAASHMICASFET